VGGRGRLKPSSCSTRNRDKEGGGRFSVSEVFPIVHPRRFPGLQEESREKRWAGPGRRADGGKGEFFGTGGKMTSETCFGQGAHGTALGAKEDERLVGTTVRKVGPTKRGNANQFKTHRRWEKKEEPGRIERKSDGMLEFCEGGGGRN